jgi:D-beta-D-heptose 7-phosphate kinase/D-beta-D-heptose 1-phosphate adenosyltransferase
MAEVRVVVVGDLMLDRYITGSVERISPEAPVPVVQVEEEACAVGGAANVAANVVALGARCQVVGCVGTDFHGDVLRRELEALGVGLAGVVNTPDRPTTVKTRVLARRQQVVRFDHEDDGELSAEWLGRLVDAVQMAVGECEVLAIEDYNKGVMAPTVIRAALEAAAQAGVPSVVDPKRFHFFEFAGATVFKPNVKELEEALTQPVRHDDPEWMEGVRQRVGCEFLVLTLGERGMAVRGKEQQMSIPTVARSVYDVSGAGDTVTAVIATALAAGAEPLEAAILANHAAAVEVGKAGVAVVTPEEILSTVRSVLAD